MIKTVWEFLFGPTEGEPQPSSALALRSYGVWVLGVGALVGLGLLVWWLWRKSKKQKARRRLPR